MSLEDLAQLLDDGRAALEAGDVDQARSLFQALERAAAAASTGAVRTTPEAVAELRARLQQTLQRLEADHIDVMRSLQRATRAGKAVARYEPAMAPQEGHRG